MICEKCGKEIPENETTCSCCNEETAAEQSETIEEVVEETVVSLEELGAPVSNVVRGKRGTARIVSGIVALVLMVAVLVVSFLKPVLIIGEWKVEQTIPTGMTADLKVESVMQFTPSGETVWTDTLLNYEEVGYPEDKSKIVNEFTYAVENRKLCMEMTGEQAQEQKLEVFVSVNPYQLSYWPEETTPRQVYDYYRNGFFYPSMYLWIAALVLLLLGVLLLAIPGKKHEITVREDAQEVAEETDAETAEESTQEAVEETLEVAEEALEAAEETTEE